MKNKILVFIIAFFLSMHHLYSQEIGPNGIYKIGEVSFKVEEIKDLNKYFVRNTKDTEIKEDYPDFLFIDRTLVNEEIFKSIILEILENKRNQLKTNHEDMKVFCSFSPNGKIQSLAFIVNNGTKISLKDIACFDQQLRKKFISQIKSSHNLHLKLKSIPFTIELSFKQ